MGDEAHWHYSTFRVTNYPPEVTSFFSPPFVSLAAAKAAIRHHITNTVVTNPNAMALIDLPKDHVAGVLAEWMSLPEEKFLYYWPWAHECYPCSGACAESALQNATEMAEWMTDAEVIPVEVVGDSNRFAMLAHHSDWGDRIIATPQDPSD